MTPDRFISIEILKFLLIHLERIDVFSLTQQDQHLVGWLRETDLRCAKNRNGDSKIETCPIILYK